MDFSRSLRTPSIESGVSVTKQDSSLITNTGDLVENNHESASSLDDTMSDKLTQDSGALVPVPDNSSEVLAAVPVSHNTGHSEIVQRRTRRPFSVSEVEALVHAVEEVGTGRFD